MKLKTPRSVELEHDKLHKDLLHIINLGGKTGLAAKEVAKALHPHFVKEEKYAMPPLTLLKTIASGKIGKEAKKIIVVTKKLEKLLPEMLKEHKNIVKKLKILEKNAKKYKNKEAITFAKKLKLHATQEEEILYPASILVGKYLSRV